jgi:hypothetical protein
LFVRREIKKEGKNTNAETNIVDENIVSTAMSLLTQVLNVLDELCPVHAHPDVLRDRELLPPAESMAEQDW